MAKKHKKSNQIPTRWRGARSDASVRTIECNIEEAFKLPKGSVGLHLPSGRRARGDKKIGKLLGDYDWS